MTKQDTASIRDVYEVVTRLEDKLDKRLTNLEKKTDTLADEVSEAKGSARTLSWIIPMSVTVGIWILGMVFKSILKI